MQLQDKESLHLGFLRLFARELVLNSAREKIEEAEEDYYEELKGTINKEKIFLEKIKNMERKIPEKIDKTSAEMLPSLSPKESIIKIPVPNRPREIIEIETPITKEIKKVGVSTLRMGKGIQKRFSMPIEEIKVQRPTMSPRPILKFPIEKTERIDLGKLNPIISDPTTRAIECAGPDKPVFVRGIMGNKLTNIKLKEEEIKEIINRFSEKTRIPIISGIFRAVLGNLMISAIISDLAGSRFIIKKLRKH